MKLFIMKVLGWLSTGHWPKKLRFPNGIPRTEVLGPYETVEVLGTPTGGTYTTKVGGVTRVWTHDGRLISSTFPTVDHEGLALLRKDPDAYFRRSVGPNPFWELPDDPFDPKDWFGDTQGLHPYWACTDDCSGCVSEGEGAGPPPVTKYGIDVPVPDEFLSGPSLFDLRNRPH